MMKEERAVEVEMRGAIAVITLNRPKTRNAVNRAMNEQAVAAMDAFDRNPKLRVAILTGAGGTFCSGMDLKAFVAEGIPSVHPWGFLGHYPPPKISTGFPPDFHQDLFGQGFSLHDT